MQFKAILYILFICSSYIHSFASHSKVVTSVNQRLGVKLFIFSGQATNGINKIFSLSGGFSTGKTTVFNAISKDNYFAQQIHNTLIRRLNIKPQIVIAFISEAATIIMKKWKKNGQLAKIIDEKKTNKTHLFKQFQQEILCLQIAQLESLPQNSMVISITDRFTLDGVGYCQLAKIPNAEIATMYNPYNNQYDLALVFLFAHFIPDYTQNTQRIERPSTQQQECHLLSQAIDQCYRENKITIMLVQDTNLSQRLWFIKQNILNYLHQVDF